MIKRVNWCIEIAKNLKKFSSKPKLIKLVSKLLGSETIEQIICQTHYKIPQNGKVNVGNDVEIGANCTIDRGTIDDTLILSL